MSEKKHCVILDKYEHGIVINALNEMRNGLITEHRHTDEVDSILLKAIDAPNKKSGRFRNEQR